MGPPTCERLNFPFCTPIIPASSLACGCARRSLSHKSFIFFSDFYQCVIFFLSSDSSWRTWSRELLDYFLRTLVDVTIFRYWTSSSLFLHFLWWPLFNRDSNLYKTRTWITSQTVRLAESNPDFVLNFKVICMVITSTQWGILYVEFSFHNKQAKSRLPI